MVPEVQLLYLIECLGAMIAQAVVAIEPTEKARDDFNGRVQGQLQQMTWTHPKAKIFISTARAACHVVAFQAARLLESVASAQHLPLSFLEAGPTLTPVLKSRPDRDEPCRSRDRGGRRSGRSFISRPIQAARFSFWPISRSERRPRRTRSSLVFPPPIWMPSSAMRSGSAVECWSLSHSLPTACRTPS